MDKPYYLEGYGEMPALTDSIPELKSFFPYIFWLPIVMRADIPSAILRKIDEAYLKAVESETVKEMCKNYHVVRQGVVGEEAQKLIRHQASIESWLLYDARVAKRSPADFDLPRP